MRSQCNDLHLAFVQISKPLTPRFVFSHKPLKRGQSCELNYALSSLHTDVAAMKPWSFNRDRSSTKRIDGRAQNRIREKGAPSQKEDEDRQVTRKRKRKSRGR